MPINVARIDDRLIHGQKKVYKMVIIKDLLKYTIFQRLFGF